MKLNNDINRVGKVVASVNEMVKLKLLQALTDEPIIYVYPVCLPLDDKKRMVNWCQNILRVWSLTYASKILEKEGAMAPGETLNIELVIFSRDNGDFICRYSDNEGLSYS